MPQSWPSGCTECEGFAQRLQDAWQSDQQDIRAHFHQTAAASGRDPDAFLLQWVLSLAQLSDDEFESLQCGRCPRAAEVRRKWKEHASLSGHPCPGDGWRAAFIFDVVRRGGYYRFLKGRRDADR